MKPAPHLVCQNCHQPIDEADTRNGSAGQCFHPLEDIGPYWLCPKCCEIDDMFAEVGGNEAPH